VLTIRAGVWRADEVYEKIGTKKRTPQPEAEPGPIADQGLGTLNVFQTSSSLSATKKKAKETEEDERYVDLRGFLRIWAEYRSISEKEELLLVQVCAPAHALKREHARRRSPAPTDCTRGSGNPVSHKPRCAHRVQLARGLLPHTFRRMRKTGQRRRDGAIFGGDHRVDREHGCGVTGR
jgi:hypothetical protein